MKSIKRKLFNKSREMGNRVIPCEGKAIPRDVPKGHLVVYVGEECKRFVIKISLLEHPLFKELLDQAKDEYDFTADSKLCIPCDESIFLDVVRRATSPQNNGRSCLCLWQNCI